MATDNVKIPNKHYVGLAKRIGENLPLGFMTPWGEDAAAIKRMQTVDHWARNSKIPATTIDNIPMSGFKLTKSIRTTNYGGHDNWRIEDPRGFELEISSGNLAQLISVGTVEQGEFLDQCVWARCGSNNVLLSTSTDEYKQAVENTRVSNIKTNWKDVKLGNRIVLQNNIRGIWLGKMHYVSTGYNNNHDSNLGNNKIVASTKAVHLVFADKDDGKNTLYIIANPKLSYIENNSIINEAEAERLVNAYLTDNNVTVHGNSNPLLFSFDPIHCGKNLTLSLVPITETDPDVIYTMLSNYKTPTIIARHIDGSIGMLSKYSNNKNPKIYHISEPHIAVGEYKEIQVLNKDRTSYYFSGASYVASKQECPISDIVGLFHININVSTKAGNSIDVLLRRI